MAPEVELRRGRGRGGAWRRHDEEELAVLSASGLSMAGRPCVARPRCCSAAAQAGEGGGGAGRLL